jgi:hypothetical protein
VLAKCSKSGELVVIENQYDKTNHDHLGKLLTYAAGVGADGSGAKTVIWIAEQFTEPHRATLDWLNKCTEPGIRFFGVEIQLWRIGESPLAPKFNVISRPNDWQKELTQETGALSATRQLYHEFWAAFIEFARKQHTTLSLPAAAPSDHYLPTGIGKGGFGVNFHINKRPSLKNIECQLWMRGTETESYKALLAMRDRINSELKSQPEFTETSRAYKIYETFDGDVTDREQWPAMQRWLKARGEAYVAVFTPLVKHLKLD